MHIGGLGNTSGCVVQFSQTPALDPLRETHYLIYTLMGIPLASGSAALRSLAAPGGTEKKMLCLRVGMFFGYMFDGYFE